MIGYQQQQCSSTSSQVVVAPASNQHLRATLNQKSAPSSSNQASSRNSQFSSATNLPDREEDPSRSPSPSPSPSLQGQAKNQQQQMLKREPVSTSCAAILSSLSSHINLINHSPSSAGKLSSQQQVVSCAGNNNSEQIAQQHQNSTILSSTAHSPPSSSVSSSQSKHLMQGIQSSSPGYHSAASSPSSSMASPVCSPPVSSLNAAGCFSLPVGISTAQSPSNCLTTRANSSNSSNSNSVSPSSSRSPISPNLLDYYPELNQDGLGLTWFHEANNSTKLNSALVSNRMLISGDISLAEMSRYPVPIMAKPPLGVSDITLEDWLQKVVHSQPQRGIKLTFTSTRTVEPAFRVLARHAELLKGPMILNADILTRPNLSFNGATQNGRTQAGRGAAAAAAAAAASAAANQQQPVDAWTFLMLCRTRFPKCIISIGWCSNSVASHTQGSQPLSMGNNSWPGNNGHHQVEGTSQLLAACTNSSTLDNGTGSCSSSIHSSADSMFELDILDNAPNAFGNLPAQQVASSLSHLQYLSHQHRINQHRIHQHLHPYPMIHQQQQQLHSLASQGGAGIGSLSQQNQLHHHLLNHHILSSGAGSLNSSSGNSSGSPSPTSPVSHLMSPPHQTVATNLSLTSKMSQSSSTSNSAQQVVDSTERLFLGAASEQQRTSPVLGPKSAAATFHQHQHQQHPHHHQQQLPLNLNINEATGEAASAHSQLSKLAQKIHHSYQQQHANSSSTNSTQQVNELAQVNKLFQQHPNKKPALAPPSATSPSQPNNSILRQQSNINSNLLLKTTSNGNQPPMGYSREMIDKMASLVKEYNLTQPVTFPVEARLLRNSLGELQRLLYQVGSNSTLTVTAQQDDLISIDDLLTIRKAFASNQVLFDLPDELAVALGQELDLL